MQDKPLLYVCRSITTFTKDAEVDDKALARLLERFIEPNIGMYVASSGSGLGQALKWEELRLIYKTAVAVGKGKIAVGANIPEQYTSWGSLEHAKLAVECGVDIVNIYGPDGRHSYRPTDAEYRTYFERIFAEVKHPISLCPNPTLGYRPNPQLMAGLANDYPQVQNIILTGITGDDLYFINLKDALKRDVDVYVTESGSANLLALGAAGMAGNLANFIPRTYRAYLDLVAADKNEAAAEIYAGIRRLGQYTAQWKGGAPRWHLMFLKAFKLPGGEGRLPDPFLTHGDAEVEKFAKGAIALNIPEVNEMARRAGLI
jgi:dihydrodipicolinate synthase/N-acetylneuraminate lyase